MKANLTLGALLAYGIFAFLHLAYFKDTNVNAEKGVIDGFWGVVQSSVDWCEPNYVDHDQIAEWHNTFSSFAIVLAGLAAYGTLTSVGIEFRYRGCALLLAIVGMGSVVFHGTLQRDMQALDEVPMLWVATFGSYCMIEHPNKTAKYGHYIKYIVAYLLVISYFTAFSHGGWAVAAFHCSFLPSELFFVVKSIQICFKATNAATKSLLEWSLIFYGIAVGTWSTDVVFCTHLQQFAWGPGLSQYPQLHAYGWHIFVAIASYGLILGVAAARQQEILGRNDIEVKYVFGIPMLATISLEEAIARSASASPARDTTANTTTTAAAVASSPTRGRAASPKKAAPAKKTGGASPKRSPKRVPSPGGNRKATPRPPVGAKLRKRSISGGGRRLRMI